jgi:TorA maturation chaperone TorD
MQATTNSLIDDLVVLAARQALYRFAALAFLDPQHGTWEQLQSLQGNELLLEAAAILRDHEAAAPDSLSLGERPLTDLDPKLVFDRLPITDSELCDEYERTFGLLVSSACTPYEMDYVDGKFTFQRSHLLADVAGYYQAFGITVSRQRPERPDHIANLLEFMAFMIGLERLASEEASAEKRQERMDVCRQAQKTFLRDHLAWWTPAFSRLLLREHPDGFYAAAGQFVAALIPAERALLEVPPFQKSVAPSTIERPEACEGCEIA